MTSPCSSDRTRAAVGGHHRVVFHDRWHPDTWYEPSQVSDGSMLAFAYLLLHHQRAPYDVVGIEEPERGLHPWLIGKIVDLFRAMSSGALDGRKTQVVVATQSAEFLNHVRPEEVRFFTRHRVWRRARRSRADWHHGLGARTRRVGACHGCAVALRWLGWSSGQPVSKRIVLYAEGGLEFEARVSALPGGPIAEEHLGAAHILVRRLLVAYSALPEGTIIFVHPLRDAHARRATGSMLHHRRSLRRLLTWPATHRRPDLAVVLVDEDGVSQRRADLEDSIVGTPMTTVVGHCVREFESWLVADHTALQATIGHSVDPPPEAESADPGVHT